MTTSTNNTQNTEVAAFFDLDGTLIKGSANIPFAVAAFKQGLVTPKELYIDFRNGLSFMLKGASDERSAEVRERILRAVEGHPKEKVAALGEGFMHKLVAQVVPEAAEALEHHGELGHDRVVISASPTEIVSRLADELGLEYGIGTTAGTTDGIYDGTLDGPFCYREGKAEIMATMAAEHGWNLAECYAYSDSISDLPMLEAVGHPVAINPERELLELAQERGWDVIITNPWRAARRREYPSLALSWTKRKVSHTLGSSDDAALA